MKTSTLLAIESSCDETGVSVVRKNLPAGKAGGDIVVLSELVASQANIHEATGGVIPEVAAREHLAVIGPMISSALGKAGVTPEDLNAIAVTVGPGLMPALAVGVQTAKTLAFVWGKDIVPVHHIEGHMYSALLQGSDVFPALGLIVSGGHTMLVEMQNHLQYNILGQTRDDAVGEVFDKVARMLQLSYPGGPKVSALAQKGSGAAYAFPRPMMHSKDLDFSYSGLKTAVLYQVQELEKQPFDKLSFESEHEGSSLRVEDRVPEQVRADIAASFEAAVVESLVAKLSQALQIKKYKSVLLAGGVAANKALQHAVQDAAQAHGVQTYIAPQALCGDNATMIGQAGVYAYEAGRKKNWKEIDAVARIGIEGFSM